MDALKATLMSSRLKLVKGEGSPPKSDSHPTVPNLCAVFGTGKGGKVYLDSWLEDGLVTQVIGHFRDVKTTVPRKPYWDLVWQLFSLKTLESQGSVKLFLDQGSNYHETFFAVWGGRYNYEEGLFIHSLTKWMIGEKLAPEELDLVRSLGLNEVQNAFDRINLLFFLIALAYQNQLLKPYVLVLDGLEALEGHSNQTQLLTELFDVCLAAERWSRIGSPLTVRLEMASPVKVLHLFRDNHKRLFDLVAQAIQ